MIEYEVQWDSPDLGVGWTRGLGSIDGARRYANSIPGAQVIEVVRREVPAVDPGGWKPRYLVVKQAGVDGPPIPADEPCLVVRGQDRLAVEFMDWYRQRYQTEPGASESVLARIDEHRAALVAWRETNPDRIKTAD